MVTSLTHYSLKWGLKTMQRPHVYEYSARHGRLSVYYRTFLITSDNNTYFGSTFPTEFISYFFLEIANSTNKYKNVNLRLAVY